MTARANVHERDVPGDQNTSGQNRARTTRPWRSYRIGPCRLDERAARVAASTVLRHPRQMGSPIDANSPGPDSLAAADNRATFLYDGDCGFCTACVGWIERYVPTQARVVPWQRSDIGALGITADRAAQAVVWVPTPLVPSAERGSGTPADPTHRDTRYATALATDGSDAISLLLRSSSARWARAAGIVLNLPGIRHAARPIYRLIARNRHRIPGPFPKCGIGRR